jgi:fructose-1,6-bisphosphatase I/sedoheptulose-1,7-bisphosphatase
MSVHPNLTLTQFLIEERRRFPSYTGDFNSVILNVAMACKHIARTVAYGALGGMYGNAAGEDTINVQGEQQKKLDVMSNDTFLRINEWGGHLAGMASEELEKPYDIPPEFPRGKYLLTFDPLDGSSNIDVNVSVGSIFSVLRTRDDSQSGDEAEFLQPGRNQVAAGYAIYGPTTMLVLTFGNGVHGFTLDQSLCEFILTHPNLRIPEETKEFAINASNARFWEAPIKRYVDECLAGVGGQRGKDFNMRWIA